MPFINVGADPNTEYLSDGIAESLINSLSQLPKLRVVPRTLVSAYKGKEMDPAKVGRDLHVRAILTGKVVQRGDSLNVQTELVDVGELSQLWGQRYDRKFSEIQAVQEDIAKQVSAKLHLRTTDEEQKRLTKRATENTEAYQLYLRGRYYWNRRTTDYLKKANEYFRQAIEKDPGYGLAYAGLAQSYALFTYYEIQTPAELCPKANAVAMKALELDDGLAETHAAMGWIKMSCDWDWQESEKEFKRAVQINPNDGTANLWYGQYLGTMGRLEESLRVRRRGVEAEPLSLIVGSSIGLSLYWSQRYDQAIDEFRKTLEIDSNFAEGHFFFGLPYEEKAMFAEAAEEFQQALRLSPGLPRFIGALGHASAISGKRRQAEDSVTLLKQASKHRYVCPYDIAIVYAGLKDKEQTFKYLEAAYEDRSWWMLWLRMDHRLDGIHDDPRYKDLVRRMHLEP
jgi:TolB-like protein